MADLANVYIQCSTSWGDRGGLKKPGQEDQHRIMSALSFFFSSFFTSLHPD